MSAEGRQLDPEIAALLRDTPEYQGLSILAEPQLDLRRTRSSRSVVPFKASNVERHLLEAYREDVAWLLRRASAHVLSTEPGSMLLRYVGVDEQIAISSRRELRAEAEHYRSGLGIEESAEEYSDLRALSASTALGPGSARRLAAASLRLVNRDDTRICLALALMHEQQMGLAADLLFGVIAGRPLALDGAIAWNNLGTTYVARGLLGKARDAFRMGAESAPYPASAISWLLQACKLGDERDALRAASHLDDLLPASHAALEEHIQRRLSQPSDFADEFWSTTRRLRDKVGPTARRVMDV